MSCPFGTMDWYCALPRGHAGPHSSAPLTAGTEPEARPATPAETYREPARWIVSAYAVELGFTAAEAEMRAAPDQWLEDAIATFAARVAAEAQRAGAPRPADADAIAEMVPCPDCGARREYCGCDLVGALDEVWGGIVKATEGCPVPTATCQDRCGPDHCELDAAIRALPRHRAASPEGSSAIPTPPTPAAPEEDAP